MEKEIKGIVHRLEFLGLTGSLCPTDAWNKVHDDIRKCIPEWLIKVLSSNKLLGVLFEIPKLNERTMNEEILGFQFIDPRKDVYQDGIDDEEFLEYIKHGWIPIAQESSCDLWAIPINGGIESPVIFCKHPDGGIHGRVSCVGRNLLLLLSVASVGFEQNCKEFENPDASKLNEMLTSQVW